MDADGRAAPVDWSDDVGNHRQPTNDERARTLARLRDLYATGHVSIGALGAALREIDIMAPEVERLRAAKTYAACPGCNARGDVAHVVACIGGAVKTERLRSGLSNTAHYWAGANAVIGVVAKQLSRRGGVDWNRVTRAVRFGRPGR